MKSNKNVPAAWEEIWSDKWLLSDVNRSGQKRSYSIMNSNLHAYKQLKENNTIGAESSFNWITYVFTEILK